MAVNYSTPVINARLQAVADTIDAGGGNGYIELLAGSTIVSTISLARPCATINGGVLTFDGTLLDPAAANTGVVDQGVIRNSLGALMVSGLTVGIPLTVGVDIIISNGLNTTLITAGQTVAVLSAQITGS